MNVSVILSVVMLAAAAPAPPGKSAKLEPVALPGVQGRIGFDDIVYSVGLDKLLVPGGETGNLYVLDVGTLKATPIKGFGKSAGGTTSANEGRYLVYAIDRASKKLCLIDAQANEIVVRVPLAGTPDYVRFVEMTNEIWVTEPTEERIEIFKGGYFDDPTPKPGASLEVKGGPESLILDEKRGVAYTNLKKGTTAKIDLKTRTITERWANGCTTARGLAHDPLRERLFVACAEGKIVTLDKKGAILSEAKTGEGVDSIAFEHALQHLYVPSAARGTLAVLGVSGAGKLSLLHEAKAAKGSRCVAVDGRKQVFVCDPERGRLLLFRDTLPASGD